MPTLSADEILTNRHIRTFIQFGGPKPGNLAQYAGQDAQYMVVEGVTVAETGGIDPMYVPDPRRQGSYRLVGRKYSPPDLSKATIKLLERHGSIPKQLQKIGCAFNVYQPAGACKDLSDFTGGWTDYVLVYSGAIVNDKDLGARSAWDADEMLEDSLSVTLADVYPVGALGFGEQAAAQVDREVVDVVYGSNLQCGNCGPADDGTQKIYAVTKSSGAGSPGLPAEVQYSLDGGLSWAESQITSIGATADPTRIDVVGSRLVVLVPSESAYYWSDIDSFTGAPGTWTKVTSGFTTQPSDIYVASAKEIWFSGAGGYVYKSTDITAGVTAVNAAATTTNDLLRIDGKDETIVAVGKASTVIKSINRGLTFATTTANPSLVAVDVQALEVLDQYRYWVGTNSGRVVYTLNGGASWTNLGFSGNGAGQVYDFVAVNDEVMFFSHSTATPTARIFASWDGGASWTNSAPRITNLPTFNRATALAVPALDAGIAANNLAVAGLSGGGTDGILLLGIASRL